MGDEYGRVGIVDRLQQFVKVLPGFGIEVGRRLVEDEKGAFSRQCDGDQQFLLHAAGEFEKGLFHMGLDIQLHRFGLFDDRLFGRAGTAMHIGQQLFEAQFHRRRQLGDKTDRFKHFGAGFDGIVPYDLDLSTVEMIKAQKGAYQCRFARSVGAQHRHLVTQFNTQAHPVQYRRTHKTFDDIVCFDNRATHTRSFRRNV